MLSNSYTIKQHTISTSTSYINHGIIPQTLLVKHLDQTSNQHISKPFNNSTKTCPQSRSGEGGPLAQASLVSPRRGLEQGSSGRCEVSLRRAPSRLGEITPRSKRILVA